METEAPHQPKRKHHLVTSKVVVTEVSRGHSSRVFIAHGEGLNLVLLEILRFLQRAVQSSKLGRVN